MLNQDCLYLIGNNISNYRTYYNYKFAIKSNYDENIYLHKLTRLFINYAHKKLCQALKEDLDINIYSFYLYQIPFYDLFNKLGLEYEKLRIPFHSTIRYEEAKNDEITLAIIYKRISPTRVNTINHVRIVYKNSKLVLKYDCYANEFKIIHFK